MRFALPLKRCKRKSFQDEIAVVHNVHYTIMDLFPCSAIYALLITLKIFSIQTTTVGILQTLLLLTCKDFSRRWLRLVLENNRVFRKKYSLWFASLSPIHRKLSLRPRTQTFPTAFTNRTSISIFACVVQTVLYGFVDFWWIFCHIFADFYEFSIILYRKYKQLLLTLNQF